MMFSNGVPVEMELTLKDMFGNKKVVSFQMNDIEMQSEKNLARVITEEDINPASLLCPSLEYKITDDLVQGNSMVKENSLVSLKFSKPGYDTCHYNQPKEDEGKRFAVGTLHKLISS